MHRPDGGVAPRYRLEERNDLWCGIADVLLVGRLPVPREVHRVPECTQELRFIRCHEAFNVDAPNRGLNVWRCPRSPILIEPFTRGVTE